MYTGNDLAQEAYRAYERQAGVTFPRDGDGNIRPGAAGQGNNDAVDAFRHAYGSGRLSQIAGDGISEYVFNRHEVGQANENDPFEHRSEE